MVCLIPQSPHLPPHIYRCTPKSNFQPKPGYIKKKKPRDFFTPIAKSYTNLFQKLRQWGMVNPIFRYTPDVHSKSFDSCVHSVYHSNVQGHNIEDFFYLKKRNKKDDSRNLIVEHVINTVRFVQYPSSSHDNAQYMGSNDLNMGTQNVSDEGNIFHSGKSSSHADAN